MTEKTTKEQNAPTAETMINLENLTKVFPGQDQPAVDDLSMEIYEGEIVVFVGPSGCGKTTTMKMINRLIEPSSGRIFLEGEDVTKVNSDNLRRRIGYVIQQIGLFPHMTIADNIATVPRMLGWDNKRISDRIDELLETVGIDLSYRNRYPKELSGGQRQRIGVARAMAADPPVLLMDEPFGAIDPITRDRLQDEFLRLQQEIRKTIVFVTHDIDEAIKMGDRIAILRTQSRIAQYDTPEKILTDPARLSDSREEVRNKIQSSERDYALLLDDRERPKRWVTVEHLGLGTPLEEAGRPAVAIVESNASLYNTLDTMITSYKGSAIVVDEGGRYKGVVDFDTVLEAINAMRPEEQTRERTARELRAGGDER